MRRSRLPTIAALALIALPSQAAFAHHSFAMFDMNKTVKLEGMVKEVQWTNPHIWVQLLVKDPDTGQDVEWSIQGNSPNMLVRAGWARKSLNAGDRAVVEIHPVRVGGVPHSGSLATVFVNGQRIFGGPRATQPEEAK